MPLRLPAWRIARWLMFRLISVLLSAAGCSLNAPMNEPLHSAAGNAEYRVLDINRSGGAESALVLVALSGGGKRSAAFAFGVLRGMADIPVRPNRANNTLLDEVDMLAGVSGGSFPAAHFALYGRKSFDTTPFPRNSSTLTSRPIFGAPFCCHGTGIGFLIRWSAPTTG